MAERPEKVQRQAKEASEDAGPRAVVALGASAGGLDALKRFFSQVPDEPGLCFVVIQHLDPDHGTMMPELLGRTTAMEVLEVRDETSLAPDHVYVIPPNATLTVEGGVLRVAEPEEERGRRTPIDHFFTSLAEDLGSKSVCIVLSGTGSDGTVGLKRVKEVGGMAIAQSAATAKYDGMPRSALSTGLVDHVLAPEDMPEVVLNYVKHLDELAEDGGLERLRQEAASELARVTALLRQRTGHDFSGYKRNTLARRVQRRIQVVGAGSVAEYLQTLRASGDEAEQLFRDLLIGVTHFFRDREAFEALAEKVIPRILDTKTDEDALRAWVPGCATGEEAYSLAMLLCEGMEASGRRPQVQIFATDIDTEALETARRGIYPHGIEEHVSEERLSRYFRRRENGWEVSRGLREMCVFSPHNLINQPPFSRLDLISCRNLLIYLHPDLQREILGLFHYALRSGAFLFLGPSESISGTSELFAPLDKKNRLYRARDSVAPRSVHLPAFQPGNVLTPVPTGQPRRPEPSFKQAVGRLVLDEYAPVSVLLDADGRVLLTTGPTGDYLALPVGEASLDILDLAAGDLRIQLRTLLHQARRSQREARQEIVREVDGATCRVEMIARPFDADDTSEPLLLVIFRDLGVATPMSAVAAAADLDESERNLVEQLEDELRITKEQLQTTVEELETSNEELKSSNEELLSMNEELQSTNEELQTSKEELQSTNEELQTLNHELQDKIDQLNTANADLQNLFESTDVAIIFLDRQLRIKRFTPASSQVFRLMERDVGRPIEDITARFGEIDLAAGVKEVLRSLEPKELSVERPEDDRSYILRIRPYSNIDQEVDGAVLTFSDVTDLERGRKRERELAEELRRRVAELAAADERKDEFLAMLSHELRNPLAPLFHALELMDGDDVEPERRSELRSLIGRQARQLSRLVNDLLDVSRITRGKIELRRSPFDLRDAIAEGEESSRHHLEQRDQELSVELPDRPVIVEGDRARLQQVVANLIHNAAKFSPAAERIEVRLETQDGHARLTIRDHGIGLEPGQETEIFELFSQGDRSLARSEGGLGVGLTMVANLVRMHGGEVAAESPGPNQGTTFSVTLPVAEPGAGAGGDGAAPPGEPAEGTPRRVLVVEDGVDAARALGELLQLWGHEAWVAHDGAQGLELFREHEPDVVLLDIGLPGMDGYEVASKIREAADGEPVLLIALTGYGQEQDVERALENGFDHHLLKPADPDDLRQLLAAGGSDRSIAAE